MTRVAVNTPILQWAIERAGLTPNLLTNKFPKIHEWLNGSIQPTFRQLEKFARTTKTPFGFFFLEQPPEIMLPIPFYRTVNDNEVKMPSPDLLDVIQQMERRQLWMRDYLIDLGHEPLPYIGAITKETDVTGAANYIRETLNLEEEWAKDFNTWEEALRFLRDATERAGSLIALNGIVGNNTHRILDPNEFRGFVLVDDYAPLIFVNNSDFKSAQMFTIAHELAHIFVGSSAAFDLKNLQPADNDTELFCNRIAAEFLVPHNKLTEFWPEAKGQLDPFQTIARHFKVSTIVAARRALDLELITKEEFFRFYNDIQNTERHNAKGQSGGSFYNNQDVRVGRKFAAAIASSIREGKLSYTEAYRLTGLSTDKLERYLALRGL